MREIEIKARVPDKQKLLDLLTSEGIVLSQPTRQEDLVFAVPNWEQRKGNRYWLRIRKEDNGKTIFTLKKSVTNELDSIEHEIVASNATELEAIIRVMGHEYFSRVVKSRQKAKIGDIELCLDEVEGLGTYIELEKLSKDHAADVEAITVELWKLFNRFGITPADQVTKGYDILIRELAS